MIEELRVVLLKTLHPKIIHCQEAPKFMLYNYFAKKKVLSGTFGEIRSIQILMYPQDSFEPKYSAFNLKKQIQCPWIGVVVQSS